MTKRRDPGSSKGSGRPSASPSLSAASPTDSSPTSAPANGGTLARPATGGPNGSEQRERTPPAPQKGPSDVGYASAEYRALKMAVEAGNVSFHQVSTAWFNSHFGGSRCPECQGAGKVVDPPAGSMACANCTKRCAKCDGTGTLRDTEADAAYAEIFPDLLRVFGEQRGGVITAYFCENIRVGAALTDIWSAADAPMGRS